MNNDCVHRDDSQWILCPLCGNKTRIKIRYDTELIRFPLFCPKCRNETIISVKHLQVTLEESHAFCTSYRHVPKGRKG